MFSTSTDEIKKPIFQVLNGLALKIIAMVFMTIDHIGYIFLSDQVYSTAYMVLRILGRLSLPLFIFLAIEGVFKSRNPYRYGLIMFGLGIAMSLIAYGSNKLLNTDASLDNIFLDLGVGIITCALLKEMNWKSLLAVFPIAYTVLAVLFPTYIHCDYDVYGLSIFIGFFIAYFSVEKWCEYFAKKNKIPVEYVKDKFMQTYRNYMCILMLLLVGVIFQLVYHFDYETPFIPFPYNMQSYAVLAGVFIFFYNGKRGFSNTVIKYGFYAYYPLHMLILYGISCLI